MRDPALIKLFDMKEDEKITLITFNMLVKSMFN